MTTFPTSIDGSHVVAAFRDHAVGKVFAITGASAGGLGAQTAIYLAAAIPRLIILLGRTPSKSASVIQEIQSISPLTEPMFVQLDLTSFSSIRSAASSLMEDEAVPHIDCLINNAGVMAPPFSLTPEGIESQFGGNHIGHFLLTNLLMPKLLASPAGSRIVNVTSSGYALGEVRFDDWNFNDGKDYEKWAGYGQSKTANILFRVELARKLGSKGVRSHAPHPGRVGDTNLAANITPDDFPYLQQLFETRGYRKLDTLLKSVPEGTSTIILCALDPTLEIMRPQTSFVSLFLTLAGHNGSFLSDNRIEETPDYTANPALARKLWELSEDLVGQKFVY